ncbi:MAG: DUF4388 domain-containing protein [Planctomycetota bacterium]|jgi:hypothetical protein
MSVSGTLFKYELPTALELLSRAKSSGILTISGDKGIATVAMHEGGVLFASSHNTPRLGEFLVEKGIVDPHDLDAVLKHQRRKKVAQLLGTILLDLGLVSKEAAELGIETQITHVLLDVLGWQEGEFRFEPSEMNWEHVLVPQCQQVGTYMLRVAMLQAKAGQNGNGAGENLLEIHTGEASS